MTGKTKKSDILDFIIELCHFSGGRDEVFLFIKNNLKLMPEYKRAVLTVPDSAADYFSSADKCIQLFNIADFPKNVIKALKPAPEHMFAVPVRASLTGQAILALILFPSSDSESYVRNLQIVAAIAGIRIDSNEISGRLSSFMKYCNAGRVAYEVFHEIKNKLIAPLTFMQTLPAKYSDEKFRTEFLALAHNELKLIQEQTEGMLHFGRRDKRRHESKTRLRDSINYCVSILKSGFEKYGVKLSVEIHGDFEIPVGSGDCRDVVFNLLLNAFEALKSKEGERSITFRPVIRAGRSGFSIADTGTGMDESSMLHLFEPFSSASESGTGLGLSIVKKIIDSAGGEISVLSTKNRGTTFNILFKDSESHNNIG